MSRKIAIAVVGVGSDIEPAISNARKLGELLAKEGWIIISGGRNAGVMKAVNEGAKRVQGSLTIGILPSASTEVAPGVDIVIITDMHNARNNVIALSGNIMVACGVDGPGTVSEIALAIKNGKKVILLCADNSSIDFFKQLSPNHILTATSPEEAIKIIKTLHS
jgi:uncharacterized protein (TIGR00725 family)